MIYDDTYYTLSAWPCPRAGPGERHVHVHPTSADCLLLAGIAPTDRAQCRSGKKGCGGNVPEGAVRFSTCRADFAPFGGQTAKWHRCALTGCCVTPQVWSNAIKVHGSVAAIQVRQEGELFLAVQLQDASLPPPLAKPSSHEGETYPLLHHRLRHPAAHAGI